jgi:hypothetical protein
MKQSSGTHATTPLTRIDFDGRSPQLDGQILTNNVDNDKDMCHNSRKLIFFKKLVRFLEVRCTQAWSTSQLMSKMSAIRNQQEIHKHMTVSD